MDLKATCTTVNGPASLEANMEVEAAVCVRAHMIPNAVAPKIVDA